MLFSRLISILHVVVFLLVLSSRAHAEDTLYTVASVINGKSFTLTIGDVVRLAAIEAPNIDEPANPPYSARSGEPLGAQARDALATLLNGKKVHIALNNGVRDRHGRLLGQVTREDGVWIQGELLRQGFAMAYSFTDDAPELITRLLAAEHEAQIAKRGIWAEPYYRIITPEETGEFINRFKLVEGMVQSVNRSHDNIYINFSKEWRGHFAVFISHRDASRFDFAKLEALVGKKVRVRGWIHYHTASEIVLTHPQQIELE